MMTMRTVLALFMVLLAGFAEAIAQDAKPKLQHYLIRLIPARAEVVAAPTEKEQKIIVEHFRHLQKAMADGKVLLAGPSVNGKDTFGLVVVEVANEAEAKVIMEADPAVQAGVFKGEVLPFNLALMKGR